jgi:hypothetical protein
LASHKSLSINNCAFETVEDGLEHRKMHFQFVAKNFVIAQVRKEEGCQRGILAALA